MLLVFIWTLKDNTKNAVYISRLQSFILVYVLRGELSMLWFLVYCYLFPFILLVSKLIIIQIEESELSEWKQSNNITHIWCCQNEKKMNFVTNIFFLNLYLSLLFNFHLKIVYFFAHTSNLFFLTFKYSIFKLFILFWFVSSLFSFSFFLLFLFFC